jgi:FtsP/CotA-like multicopper oxidase with cupredoxin domain
MTTISDPFPTETSGLPTARPSEWLELADGDVLDLRIGPVAKHLGDTTVRMLAYNGSVPGPVLRVQQHSTLVVNVFNEGDLDATVHWHGLRLEALGDEVDRLGALLDVARAHRIQPRGMRG